MDIEWVLPVAKEAYQHRDEIQKAWQKILAILLGKKTKIAFTGMAGTGKTVLFDYLTDKAYKRDYKPPLPTLQSKDIHENPDLLHGSRFRKFTPYEFNG